MSKTFFSDHGFRIIFVVVFLLSFVWMGTKRTLQSNSNNVADWLPATFKETQEYNWFLEYFPFESFVVISWDGCTLDDDRVEHFAQRLVPGQTIDNIAEWMSGIPKLVVDVGIPDTGIIPSDPLENEVTSATTVATSTVVASTASKPQTDNVVVDQPQYFKNVITGQRLIRLLEERYGADPSSPTYLTEDQIFERLDGVLIGPRQKTKTSNGEVLLPMKKSTTAMIVTLYKQPNEKALRKVLTRIKEIARECGVEPSLETDHRFPFIKAISNLGAVLQEMVNPQPHKLDGIVIGGPPVDNVAIGVEGERTLFRLAGLCALIGLTVAMFCFQSFRLTMFVFWIAILAAGLSLAFVSLTGSRCDAIMLSMPALIYVLSMSGSVHIINYYHDAIRDHGIPHAAETAIRLAWYPCFMAAFTTAIGLGSLYFSHLIPIMKFGFYSAIGVMATLLLLFFYLPALLHFYPSRKYAETIKTLGHSYDDKKLISRFWRNVGSFVVKHNLVVSILCSIMMLFFAWHVFDIKTSVKMMRFYSPNAEIIAHYTRLEEKLGPLVPMEIVIKFDNSQCKEFNPTLERLRFIQKIGHALRKIESKGADGEISVDIGGVMSAATMTPDPYGKDRPGTNSYRMYGWALNGLLEKHRRDLKDYINVEGNPSILAKDLDYLKNLQQLGFTETDAALLRSVGLYTLKDILAIPAGQTKHGISVEEMKVYHDKCIAWEKKYGVDLWRVSMRVWSLKKDIDYSKFINDVKRVVDPMVDEYLAKILPEESKTYPERPPIIDPVKKNPFTMTWEWLYATHQGFYKMAVPPPSDPVDPRPVQAVYSGMVPVVYKTQHELIAGLVDSLAMAFVLIAITLMFVLKNPIAGLLAMVPNVFPVLVVFGFMGWQGILVDVGTMMTASVAMGIAVDNTVHYMTWFRAAIDQGFGPQQAAIEAYARCATAMTQTTLIGGIGLAAFAFSTFTPTQMFGVMMLTMLSVSLFGDLVFLPSILTGPAGKVFIQKSKSPLNLPADVVPELTKPDV